MTRLNHRQLDHLAKILGELANLSLVGLTLNQILATTPFHPWIFGFGLLSACLLHLSGLYLLEYRQSMTDLTPHDLNVFMALAGLFAVGMVLAISALFYDWYARKHQSSHPHSH